MIKNNNIDIMVMLGVELIKTKLIVSLFLACLLYVLSDETFSFFPKSVYKISASQRKKKLLTRPKSQGRNA